MMKRLAVVSVLAVLANSAVAGIITVGADGADQTWRDDGTNIWVGQKGAGVGYDGTQKETAHIVPFALPDLGGETITSVNFKVGATDSGYGAGLSLDLYGVRVSASNATAASDFYRGTWDTSGTNGTAIQQAYAVKIAGNPAPANPREINSDAGGATALGAWLQSLYDGGAQPGDFAFLRVNPDQDYLAGSNSYIYMYTANSTAASDIAGGTTLQLPVLEITTIPEPATLGMVLLSVGALLLRRRRNH